MKHLACILALLLAPALYGAANDVLIDGEGANGRRTTRLADPGADRILFFDDSAGLPAWLGLGSGLEISGTSLAVSSTYALPDQSGNSGKFLTTDGTNASWVDAAGVGDMTKATYDTDADDKVDADKIDDSVLLVSEGNAAYQPLNDNLSGNAALTPAADRGFYFTNGDGEQAVYTLTSFGRTLAGSADAGAARTSLAAAGTGAANTFTDLNTFSLVPDISETALSGGTSPAWNRRYTETVSGTPVTYALPAPAALKSFQIRFTVSGATTITLDPPGSQTIYSYIDRTTSSGGATLDIALEADRETVVVESDGTNYFLWHTVPLVLQTSLAVADLNDTATPSVLTAYETSDKTISNYKSVGADHVFTLPAPHAAGKVRFVVGDEFQVDIEPTSGGVLYLNGTALTADEHIVNIADTLGDMIEGACVNVNGSLQWMFWTENTNWTEETP